MDLNRGMFIAIEGTEGSGRTDQFIMLRDKLIAAGYDVVSFDFPQHSQPSSYFAKRFLSGDYGTAEHVGPYAASLFFALDRFDAAIEIRKAVSDGKIVLANRFTASNMAHQGTKFANAEERRGFYIWLDNLEYMLLKIPRPDVSFVLRVQAQVTKGSDNVSDTDGDTISGSRVVSTAFRESLVRVYDELCQLFPKDFRQIDCVRSGKIMEASHIQQRIWESLQAYLPPAPTKNIDKSHIVSEVQVIESQPQQERAVTEQVNSVKVSALLAAQVGLCVANISSAAQQGADRYYIPKHLVQSLNTRYSEVMDSLFELYGEMKHRLPTDKVELLRSVVPVAAVQAYKIDKRSQNLLKGIDSQEARALRSYLLLEEGEGVSAFTRGNTIARMASDLLPTTYANSSGIGVQNFSVVPRNELDLLPQMLYPSSNLSLRDIYTETASWPYEQKAAIYAAYLAAGNDPAHALKDAHYSWDVSAPFAVVRDLQAILPEAAISWQLLSPRNGYDIPEAIDDAGLSDLYERCFDISLELYSELQAAGLHNEAQYATLHGHYTRCNLRINGQETRKLLGISIAEQTPDTAEVLLAIQEKLTEIHPLLLTDLRSE
jgi:dTMP kinase